MLFLCTPTHPTLHGASQLGRAAEASCTTCSAQLLSRSLPHSKGGMTKNTKPVPLTCDTRGEMEILCTSERPDRPAFSSTTP